MNQTELLLLQGLIGQVLPPLTDLINKNIPSSKIRFLSSMLVCLVIALAFNYKNLMLGDFEGLITSAGLLFTSAQSAYKFYYGDSAWQQNIRFTTSPLPLKELLPPVKFSK